MAPNDFPQQHQRRDRDRDDFVRVNHQIRVPKIRVVTDSGEMLGVMSPMEALREADKRGLDLVEISPKAQPPVCKIMDYGKFKYEQKKKAHTQRKAQPGNVIKEITLSPSTDKHDLDFKMKNSMGFLEDGNRVKVTIRFRGREMAHPEIGRQQMDRVIEALKAHGAPESNPKMEGKLLIGVFAPLSQLTKGKTAPTGLGNSVLGAGGGAAAGAASSSSSSGSPAGRPQKPIPKVENAGPRIKKP